MMIFGDGRKGQGKEESPQRSAGSAKNIVCHPVILVTLVTLNIDIECTHCQHKILSNLVIKKPNSRAYATKNLPE
jgi:DNA-directed RNA polymerase subunit RPC12/RpoP